MYVFFCVFMYVCVYICMNIFVYLRVCVYIYMYNRLGRRRQCVYHNKFFIY